MCFSETTGCVLCETISYWMGSHLILGESVQYLGQSLVRAKYKQSNVSSDVG